MYLFEILHKCDYSTRKGGHQLGSELHEVYKRVTHCYLGWYQSLKKGKSVVKIVDMNAILLCCIREVLLRLSCLERWLQTKKWQVQVPLLPSGNFYNTFLHRMAYLKKNLTYWHKERHKELLLCLLSLSNPLEKMQSSCK